MLRTNLSTKPFYNERALHAALAAVALLVVALTVFNLTQIVLLTRRQSALASQADAAENTARGLRARAAAARQSINTKQLDASSAAAKEANAVIGQRLFSWTELLNRLETTLPDDVRITSMRPTVDAKGEITLLMTVVGRKVEDIDRFMGNLQNTGAFTDVFPREETAAEDGLRQATIEGRYLAR